MEFLELVSFFRQAGLAVAGGSSLWALLFLLKARRGQGGIQQALALEWAANRLLLLFFGAFALGVISWLYIIMALPVFGHEGITLYPSLEHTLAAYDITFWGYAAWIALTGIGLGMYASYREKFKAIMPWFFAAQFLLVSWLISMYAWTGEMFSAGQIFYYFHGFHSIFTLGTVLTLDFTFISIRRSLELRRHIFPFFPQISKIIWIGLGLDFLSVALVFDEALVLGPRFFVAQTVVSILIINGAFLSGPLTRHILGKLQQGVEPLAGRWQYIAAVCGSISIISWLTITFIDFFPNITLSYGQMISVYGSAIGLAFAGNWVAERFNLAVAHVPEEITQAG